MKTSLNKNLDFTNPKHLAKGINVLFEELLKIDSYQCFGMYENYCGEGCEIDVLCKKHKKLLDGLEGGKRN